MANPRDNFQFVPSGEHPLLEWPREDVEWLDGDGLRFRDVVTLEDAPGFCVPWRFDACFDDPGYPVVIRLTIVNGEFVEAVLKPRLDRNPELIKIDGGSAWIGRAPRLPVGSIPEIPASRLLRDALARATMPVERPLVSEVDGRTREVAAALPIRRAQRYSPASLAVIRSAYSEALLAGITTKNAQRDTSSMHSAQRSPSCTGGLPPARIAEHRTESFYARCWRGRSASLLSDRRRGSNPMNQAASLTSSS